MARPRLVSLILALVTVLLYLPASRYGFVVFDDPDYVTENHVVQRGLTWEGVGWAFTTFHAGNWHPLTWMSHQLDWGLFGPVAGGHHFVNILLHTLNAVLLFQFLIRMTGAMWRAAFVAALFAWHPLRVESVAWVAERKDVLSAFFGLLALRAYVNHAKENRPGSQAASVLFFSLSLLCKPMLVTLPFVMLLLDYWPLNRVSTSEFRVSDLRRRVLEKWPFFLLTVASCVVTYLAQRAEAVVSLDRLPLGPRVANAVIAYAKYLAKTICPTDLAVIYPLPRQVDWPLLALSLLSLIAISSLSWRFRRRCPALLVGWLWFLGMLVPVIGLVQVGGQAMADRYTYLPLVGVIISGTWGLWTLLVSIRVPAPVVVTGAAALLISCLVSTAHQLRYWRDSETLFAHAVTVTGENAIARINLGVALEQQGKSDEALAEYNEALRIDPSRVQVHNNLANLLDVLGRNDEALVHYREALRLKPDAPLVHLNLGSLLVKLGRYGEAMQEYALASQLAPTDPRPYYLMGRACLKQGRGVEAVDHFREALRLVPDDIKSLTQLARTLATDPDAAVRNGGEALALARRANDLTVGQQPFVLDTLAAALAEAGRFDEAQWTIQQAIERAGMAGETEVARQMQQRLMLYQSGQPWREATTNTVQASKPATQ